MRLTRHARSRQRLYRISDAAIEHVVRCPTGEDCDERGNPMFHGCFAAKAICVIVAADDPSLIITVYETRI